MTKSHRITKRAGEAIARQLRAERFRTDHERAPVARNDWPDMWPAKVTTTVTAAVMVGGDLTPGEGVVVLQLYDRDLGAMGDGEEVLVSNTQLSEFAVDERVFVFQDQLGNYWINATTSSSSLQYYLFTLTADMAATVGATAAATITGVGSVTITNSGKFRPYSGATGLCVQLGDGTYWIIHVNQPGDLLVTLDRLNASSGSGLYTYGAHPDQANAKIKLTSPAPIALQPYPFSFQHSSLSVDVPNPLNLFGNYLDQALVRWSPADEAYYIADIYPASQNLLWVTLNANRSNGLGQIVACNPADPASRGAMPSTPFNVTDIYNVAINGRSGDRALVAYDNANPNSGYYFVLSRHRANKVKGTLNGAFSGTPTTFSVTVVAGLDGDAPSSPLTVTNRFGWDSGASGEDVWIEWDNHAGVYIAVQKDCTA